MLALRLLSLSILWISMALYSCVPSRPLVVVTDVPETILLVQAYNAKESSSQHLVEVAFSKTPYTDISYTNVGVIISSTPPKKENTISLIERLPSSKHVLARARSSSYSRLLSFSLPLILLKKSDHARLEKSFPPIPYISHSQLQRLLTEILPKRALPHKWLFPLSPHKSFSHTFARSEEYLSWMRKSFEKFDNKQKEYSDRYEHTTHIATLENDALFFKYLPSHLFFNLPKNIVNEFAIFIVTNDMLQIPIADPVYVSLTKTYSNSFSARAFFRWIFNRKNQQYAHRFARKTTKYASSAPLFLGRSYSSIFLSNALSILPQNEWLWKYGPIESDLDIPSLLF